MSAVERCDGYAAAMMAAGLAPRWYVPTLPSPYDAGQQALEALTQGPDAADALILANDNLAIGALLAAQRHGIAVPGQCAIMGFGDYPLGEKLLPALTTIRPPATEMGMLAAQRALELLGVLPAEPPSARLNQLPCLLIARASA